MAVKNATVRFASLFLRVLQAAKLLKTSMGVTHSTAIVNVPLSHTVHLSVKDAKALMGAKLVIVLYVDHYCTAHIIVQSGRTVMAVKSAAVSNLDL